MDKTLIVGLFDKLKKPSVSREAHTVIIFVDFCVTRVGIFIYKYIEPNRQTL